MEESIEDIDVKFLDELHMFVKELPEVTNEIRRGYDERMKFMETIHNEIRAENPRFMPEYSPVVNDGENYGGNAKYMDSVYNVVI